MGFQVETNKIERTMEDIIKELTKEEWEWLEMDPEVNTYRFPRPKEWDPPKDPRPKWRVKETQDQAEEEDTQTRVREENLQPRIRAGSKNCKSRIGSEEDVGTTSSARAGRSDKQNISVPVKDTKNNDDNSDGDASLGSGIIKSGSDPNLSQAKEKRISTTRQNPVEEKEKPKQEAEDQFLLKAIEETDIQVKEPEAHGQAIAGQ